MPFRSSIILLGIAATAFMHGADAETINVSALNFVLHRNLSVPDANQGLCNPQILNDLVTNACTQHMSPATYRTSVDLPDGEAICRFALIAQGDYPQHRIEARLMRRAMAIGDDGLDVRSVVLAKVDSGPPENSMRIRSTVDIRGPNVDESRYFYFAELEFTGHRQQQPTPGEFRNFVLGVQIETGVACP